MVRKADAGQMAIINALRAVGCMVEYIHGRKGLPDLLCSYHGHTFLIEVKAPLGIRGGKSEHGQALNEDQLAWHKTWQGTVLVVRSPEEAVRTVQDLWKAA